MYPLILDLFYASGSMPHRHARFESMNIHTFLTRDPAAPADAVFIREGASTFSRADLERESARHATLFTSLGFTPGERVAAWLDQSPQMLFLYFGVLRAGLVFVPLPPGAGKEELAHILRGTTPRAIVCGTGNEAAMQSLAPDAKVYGTAALTETLNEALPAAGPFETVARSDNDLALVRYAPRRPDGVMLSHANLAFNAAAVAKAWALTGDDTLLSCLPEPEIAAWHAALLAGASLQLHPAAEVKGLIAGWRDVTVLMGAPALYEQLLADPALASDNCRHIRLFLSGTAPLPARTFNDFQTRSAKAIVEYYGVPEGGILVSSPVDGEHRAGKAGLRLPEHRLRLVGANLKPMPFDHVGDIVIQGPNVCQGYWNNRARTEAAWQADGWFRTGDTGSWDEDGYITITTTTA